MIKPKLITALMLFAHFCANASCDITASFNYSLMNSTVFFSDESSNGIYQLFSWHWEMGDGTFSDVQDPVHTYPEPGNYNVCLTISGQDQEGNACTSTQCVSVNISNNNCNIVSNFSCNLLEDGLVYFQELTTTNSNTQDFGFQWNFGNGSNSSDPSTLCAYSEPGIYHVCLLATGISFGNLCSSSFCMDIEINNFPCEISSQVSDSLTENCILIPNNEIQTGTFTTFNSMEWLLDGIPTDSSTFGSMALTPGTHEVCSVVYGVGPSGNCSSVNCEIIEAHCDDLPTDNNGLHPDSTTSAENNEEFASLKIYPNPATDLIKVENSQAGNIEIYDMLGQLIWTLYLNAGNHSIALSEINPGYYILTSQGVTEVLLIN